MKAPLIRQGAGQADVRRIYENIAEEQANIARMIDTATAPDDEQQRRARGIIAVRSAAGDEQRLRMIPAIARGVAGAIPGTAPHTVRLWLPSEASRPSFSSSFAPEMETVATSAAPR